MLAPDAEPQGGGVVRLDLKTFATTSIPHLPDANGIALSSEAFKV
jgi:hypothetical protein